MVNRKWHATWHDVIPHDALRSVSFSFKSALAAAVLTSAVLLIAYAWTPAIRVPVSNLDSLIYHNVHEIETLGAITLRWTTDQSRITLPQIGRPSSGILSLGLWTPDIRPPVPLIVGNNNQPFLTMPILPGSRTATFLVPHSVAALDSLDLDLVTSP